MSDNGYSKPLPKTALHEYKLKMSGPMGENQRRPPQLSVMVAKNNPRITVFTNVEGDKQNGKIDAPMDGQTFFTLMGLLQKMADGEPDDQVRITNKVGPPQKRFIISHTVVGKDKEGRVFICVYAEGRPKIKFTFGLSDWHEILHKDGSPYSEAEISVAAAKGWVTLFTELVANVMNTHYIEPEPRNGGGGGNRGGGGGGYNRGGGNNRSSGGFDADFDSGGSGDDLDGIM